LVARVRAIRLTHVLRSWRRQPFEVAFQIDIIELSEIAAFKRIDASLDLRARSLGLMLMFRVGIWTSENIGGFAPHGSAPAARRLR
jgi:hypothetical protein